MSDNLDVVKMPGTVLADVRYRIGDYFIVGFQQPVFTQMDVYVTLEKLPQLKQLTLAELRCLKREFVQFYGARFWCEIAVGNKPALRFAKFFGFKETYRDNTRVYCLKET